MGIPLPLPFESAGGGAGVELEGVGIIGAAVGVLDSIDQFRRGPSMLPPVTGREMTVEEMVRDYAAAAAIGVGVIPPGGPGGPDPRLSIGLAAAVGYGAWQVFEFLKRNGPTIGRWGSDLWAWLNKRPRGTITTALPNVPAGVALTYTYSPRRTGYYVQINRVTTAFGIRGDVCPYLFGTTCSFELDWLNGVNVGQVEIIPTGPPTITFSPPFTSGGVAYQEVTVGLTGTTSNGATATRVTIGGGNSGGEVGTFRIRVIPKDGNTAGWTEVTNIAPFADIQAPTIGAFEQAEAPLLPPAAPPPPAIAPQEPEGDPITQPAADPIDAPIVPPVMAPIRVPLPGTGTRLLDGSLPAAAPAPVPVTDPTATVPWPGATPIPGVGPGPAPTMTGIASELGKIERKIELAMTPGQPGNLPDRFGSLLDLVGPLIEAITAAVSGTTYTLDSPCELDSQGNRLPAVEIEAPGALTQFGAILNRIDALAELIQAHKDLKQPNCRGADVPIGGEFVTVNFEQIDP